MYNDTVTLFNFHTTANGDVWYGKVLQNVDLITDHALLLSKYGENGQDNARLHVKYEKASESKIINGFEYLDPKEWARAGRYEETVTFQPQKDFFVKGAWPELIVNDEDYKKGFFDAVNMLSDNCFMVSSVGGPYDLIPHFEILGK